MRTIRQTRSGFTLVETLLVVMIMGMLAAIVIPRYELHRQRTAMDATKANIETIRTAINIFYESEGNWPDNNLTYLVYSPNAISYLSDIPYEAITHTNTVVNVSDYNGGWVYDPATHAVFVNLLGNDLDGTPYSNY